MTGPFALVTLLALTLIGTSADAASSAAGFYQYYYDSNSGCTGTPSRIRTYALPNTGCNLANTSDPYDAPSYNTLTFDATVLGTATFVQNCNSKQVSPCGICQSTGTSGSTYRYQIATCTASTVKFLYDCNADCTNCTVNASSTVYQYSTSLCTGSGSSEQNAIFGRPPATWATAQTTTNTATGVFFYAATTLFQYTNCTGSLGGKVFGCNNSCVVQTGGNASTLFVCTGVADLTTTAVVTTGPVGVTTTSGSATATTGPPTTTGLTLTPKPTGAAAPTPLQTAFLLLALLLLSIV